MPFITDSNLKRIITSVDLMNIDFQNSDVERYPYQANKLELSFLFCFKLLLKDADSLHQVLDNSIGGKDTFKWVYEGLQPAYHRIMNCDRITVDFENFEVPMEFRDDDSKVIEFRRWFKKYLFQFKNKPDIFMTLFEQEYGFQTNIKGRKVENSFKFPIDYSIESLDVLDQQFHKLNFRAIAHANFTYNKRADIILKYGKISHYAYHKVLHDFKDDKYSNEVIVADLKNYYEKFKKPLFDFCLNYYRLKYNPTLEFSEEFLLKVGFKYCSSCNRDKF